MTQVLRGQSALRMVRKYSMVGIAVTAVTVLATGLGLAQTSSVHGRAYPGASTVSVATLRVPEQAWKHFEKARVLAANHQNVESERECEKALAIAPSFPAAHILDANLQVFLRDYEAAISNVAAARKSDANVAWAGIILAGAFNGLHRYEDAMAQIQSLEGSEASSWQAKYEETRAAIGLGDEEEALKLSAELLQVAPNDFPDAILVRANALMMAQRWSEAVANMNGYLALPGQLAHREQVSTALAEVTRQMHSTDTVALASK